MYFCEFVPLPIPGLWCPLFRCILLLVSDSSGTSVFTSFCTPPSSMLNQEVIDSIVDLVTRRLENSRAAGQFSSPQHVQPQPQQQNLRPPSPEQLDCVNANGLLDTPQPAENSLRRSASVSSSSSLRRSVSASSAESRVEESQQPDLEPEVDAYDAIVPHRRGNQQMYHPSDKDIVNRPVMVMLDALYLAPIPSNLFCRKKRKGSNEFKRNADLKFKMLKALLKPTIRRLVRDSHLRQPDLETRFFWCAYDLVRKRRANHIQSWRRNQRPLELIYGGQEEYNATYQSAVPRIPHSSCCRRASR